MSAGALERVVETGLIIGNPVVGLGYQINSMFSDEGSAVERGLDHLIENAPSKIDMRLYHGTKPLGRRYFDVMLTAVSLAAGVLSGARMLPTLLRNWRQGTVGAVTNVALNEMFNPEPNPTNRITAAVAGYITGQHAARLQAAKIGLSQKLVSAGYVHAMTDFAAQSIEIYWDPNKGIGDYSVIRTGTSIVSGTASVAIPAMAPMGGQFKLGWGRNVIPVVRNSTIRDIGAFVSLNLVSGAVSAAEAEFEKQKQNRLEPWERGPTWEEWSKRIW